MHHIPILELVQHQTNTAANKPLHSQYAPQSKLSQLVASLCERQKSRLYHIGSLKGKQEKLLLLGFLFILRQELSKMPAAHMAELLFRQQSQCILLLQGEKVVGGINFRALKAKYSCELTLMAVERSYQRRGVGSRLMSQFKSMIQAEGYRMVVTCADNRALEFYLKQGFDFKTSRPLGVDARYLQHYTNSTFMYLLVQPNIQYHLEKEIYHRQRRLIVQYFKQSLCKPITSINFKDQSISRTQPKANRYKKIGTLLASMKNRAEPQIKEFPQRLEQICILRYQRPIDLREIEKAYQQMKDIEVEPILSTIISFLQNAWSLYRENDRLRENIEILERQLESFLIEE